MSFTVPYTASQLVESFKDIFYHVGQGEFGKAIFRHNPELPGDILKSPDWVERRLLEAGKIPPGFTIDSVPGNPNHLTVPNIDIPGLPSSVSGWAWLFFGVVLILLILRK